MKLTPSANKLKGFSLIELLVAVTIIIIITSVALYNQAKFSSDILITNAAYEVALTVRQAQVYGISSKGTAVVNLDQYRSGYGVHFDSVSPANFVFFIDAPDGAYNAPNQDAVYNYILNAGDTILPQSPIGFTQGQKFRRFCAHNSSASIPFWECWPDSNATLSLDIVFVKPNPDAHIIIGKSGIYTGGCLAENKLPTCGDATLYDQAIIVIESGLGDRCRTVRVFSTGQISVDSPTVGDSASGCNVNT